MVRATGNVSLKRIKEAWGKLYNAENMNPYLSSVFSHSMSINQAEKGYNKDKIQVPQINLAHPVL